VSGAIGVRWIAISNSQITVLSSIACQSPAAVTLSVMIRTAAMIKRWQPAAMEAFRQDAGGQRFFWMARTFCHVTFHCLLA
jgi:hypothetical protein